MAIDVMPVRRGLAYSGIDYRIVDSDAHVTEPPDVFEKRVPAKLRDRAPKSVKLPNGGDAWSIDGGKAMRPLIAPTNTGGLPVTDVTPDRVISYDTIRPSHFDPIARVQDMDLDGIGAEVIYPSFALGGAATYGDDPDLQRACARAYNDWLVEEFAGRSGGRIFGLAILPITGVDDAIAEARDALKKGHRGVILSRWPNGTQRPSDDDAKFWDFAQNNNVPIAVHIGGGFTQASASQNAGEAMGPQQVALGTMAKCGATSMPVIDALLGQAIGERFPKVKILLVECNIGWIPCYLEQADDRWLHYRFYTGKEHLKMAPSDQFKRNFWASFMCDSIGVELRHYVNVDHVMWSTDYPHGGHEWPNSRNQIDRLFRDVPYDETKKMLHDNAANFYNLTGV